MSDILKLTEGYVAAFGTRDINKVANYFADEFELTDPDVSALGPKGPVLEYIERLFSSHDTLEFEARNILVDGDKSVIHFTLALEDIVFDGVDVITWKFEKMTSMHAYLTRRS